MAPTLKVQRHYPDMPLPSRGHPGDAGLDLTAMDVTRVRAGLYSVDTGVSVQPPPGYYCEVVPRSSIVKTDFALANSIGVIDPDYRGRILVLLRYVGAGSGEDRGAVEARELLGKRVAQILMRRLEPMEVEAAENLDTTVRGAGGFGSTGR
jgi:dUTP pyrophosphatase